MVYRPQNTTKHSLSGVGAMTMGDTTAYQDINDEEMNRSETKTCAYHICDNESSPIRQKCGLLVKNETFKSFMLVLIITNSIMMGIATFDFVTQDEYTAFVFERIDLAFLIVFTIEIIMHFIYRGGEFFNKRFLVFDLVIISFSWAFASMQVFRAVRIVRATRVMSRIKDIRDMTEALCHAATRIFAVGLLLILFFYICGVMFTQLFKDLYADGITDRDYFSRLDKTLFTLFQLMTLDSWASVTKQVMVVYPWAWAPIIAFILISSFTVLNLVIGIMCDAVAEIHEEHDDKLGEHIVNACSTMTDRSESYVNALEMKVDELTDLVEKLLKDHVRHD